MAWAALCALLIAGVLGPLHRGLHPGATGLPALPSVVAADSTASSVFAVHDDGDVQCRLLDQALQFHGTAAAIAWLPAALPQAAPVVALGGGIDAQAFAAYCARAPPRAA